MKPLRQAELVRHIKAALKAAADMRLIVTGYRVTFSQGIPCVEVQTAQESPHPLSPQGGEDVQTLKKRLAGLRRG